MDRCPTGAVDQSQVRQAPRQHHPDLFLYGSLLTGIPDRRLNTRLRRLLRRARPAVIQARLYNLGRYPGVIVSTAGRTSSRLPRCCC